MKKIHQFFQQNELLAKVAEEYPFVYEQPTRAFFYRNSTFDERVEILEQHMGFMEKYFKKDVFLGLYGENPYTLWESKDEIGSLRFELSFNPGERKEGLLSVVLHLDDVMLYRIMFWISPDKKGDMSLWIGAMQGAECREREGSGQKSYPPLPLLPHEEFHPSRDAGSRESARPCAYLCCDELRLLCKYPHAHGEEAEDQFH